MTDPLHSPTNTGSSTAPTPELLQQLGQRILSSDMALAIFSPEDTLYFASGEFCRLYGIQPGRQTFDSMVRHCFHTGVGPRFNTDDIDAWLADIHSLRRKTNRRLFEADFIDGRWMLISEFVQDDGWLVLSATDITPIKTEEQTLRRARDTAIIASETDHLTRLLNRGAIMARLDALIVNPTAANQPLLIALMDIDHFKSINDNFGHTIGDAVLQHFCDTMRATVRDSDWLGRVGGEEFLLVMRDTTEDQARKILLRMRDYLQQNPFQNQEAEIYYTFSAGIANWQAQQTLSDLYKAADRALYAAKLDGRNLIRLAKSENVVSSAT